MLNRFITDELGQWVGLLPYDLPPPVYPYILEFISLFVFEATSMVDI